MNEIDDINSFFSMKGEEEILSKDWDSSLPVKLKKGSRVIAKYRGQSIVQLPDGSIYKV
jgi:hypothetical protein|tara:strand:- start:4132 stop:4308 length:177 start_codon:yes stop_codon:yes gene_type:complete